MKKPPKPWRPVPVAVQIARHKKALAAKKHPAHHRKPVKHAAKHHHKKRKWTPDGDVALCAARAVAEAFRIATGRAVSDADVLAWYWSTASDPDEGQAILDALSAAGGEICAGGVTILGVDWPQPHAVAVGPDGRWWSWGEPYEPWTTEISEAWSVRWRQ